MFVRTLGFVTLLRSHWRSMCFCCSSRTVPQNSLCICLGFGCLAGSGWPQRTNKECKCLQSRYSYSSHEPLNLNCFVSPQFPMASDLSFLFVGIRFDRKKFNADIARFRVPISFPLRPNYLFFYPLLCHMLTTVIFPLNLKRKKQWYWFGDDFEHCQRRRRENNRTSGRRESRGHQRRRRGSTREPLPVIYILLLHYAISCIQRYVSHFCFIFVNAQETVKGFNVFRSLTSVA